MKIISYQHVSTVDSNENGESSRKVLRVIVDDADEFANMARSTGILLEGPVIQEDKRVYTLLANQHVPVTIQSEK
ncbi:hypothetical protein [Halobacillus salinus]|uniref:hypothetical protein n=1 Tax=Halobacillus salinus TaxID=192814 RepID=UPI0009A86B40|nr:hypothetical protein [Halobacillus salinus]